MWITPRKASTEKYSSMIGPNIRPTLAVPRDWMKNRPIRMAIAVGITKALNPGLTVVSPSTADSTEIAGVIIESP